MFANYGPSQNAQDHSEGNGETYVQSFTARSNKNEKIRRAT